MIDKLSIVNACLYAVGSDKVPDLEYPDADTDMAIDLVEQVQIELLSMGWWFNTDMKIKLQPSSVDGTIALPATFLSWRVNMMNVSPDRLQRRSGYLHDSEDHTSDLRGIVDNEGNVVLDVIVYIDIEDLPETAKQYVRGKARNLMLKDTQAPEYKVKQSDEEIATSFALLQREQLRVEKNNTKNSPMVAGFTAMAGMGSFMGRVGNPLGGKD